MSTTQFIPVRPTIHGAGTSVTATPAPPIDTSDFAVPEDPTLVTKTHNKALVYTLIVIAVILLLLLFFLTYYMTQRQDGQDCSISESAADTGKPPPADHQACAVLPTAPSGGGEQPKPASKPKPTDASIAEEIEFLNSIKSKKSSKNKSQDTPQPPVQHSHQHSHHSQAPVTTSAALSTPITEPADQLPSLRQAATVVEPNNVITEPSSSLWTLHADNDKDFSELFDDRKSVTSVKSAKSDKSNRSVKIVGPYDMVPIPTYVKQEAVSKTGPEAETLRNGADLTLRQWYDMSTTYKHPKFNRFIATNKMQSAFKSAGLKN